MSRAHECAPRQAAAWRARRPCPNPEALHGLAELLREVTDVRSGALLWAVHEPAAAVRFASVGAAVNGMVRDHNRRQALGDRALPARAAKAEDFRRNFSDRAAWVWISCP